MLSHASVPSDSGVAVGIVYALARIVVIVDEGRADDGVAHPGSM